jgi:multiple sugar transport system ATP-binding protein
MTVRQNMGFALRMARVPRAERERKVAEAARVLQLDPCLDRKPKELSGGQRQRVAIGRAIVRNPRVFLFDEPLSNLDAALRGQMRIELSRLHEELAAAMIYVTHD